MDVHLWPWQARGLDKTIRALQSGETRILRAAPTGAGKTRETVELLKWARSQGQRAMWLVSRRLLLEQTAEVLKANGLNFGIRAAGHEPKLLEDIQLSSLQTELSRVYKRGQWSLHQADLLLVDEPQTMLGGGLRNIIADVISAGGKCVAQTATPFDMEKDFTCLIAEGTNSELREHGAHVICRSYGPDEPDLRHVRKVKIGEDPTDKENSEIIMVQGIFGRVRENWLRLNPLQKPTILFAPGVEESIWFTKKFEANGIPAAHIDAERILYQGEWFDSTPDNRRELIAAIRDGRVRITSNRYVLREAIDIPELYCCIMATVFGSLESYLQSGGRLLRSHPTLDHVILQDHGGNYYRHGSLNEDRNWTLGICDKLAVAEKLARKASGEEQPPITCPKCFGLRLSGPICPHCGYRHEKGRRLVVQQDGRLIELPDEEAPKPKESEEVRIWKQCYWRCRKSGRTFKQARGMFWRENGFWPAKNLPFMPRSDEDWGRRIADVNYRELRQPV